MNAIDAGMTVDIEDHTDTERVLIKLGERDRQLGFAALLRHCDLQNERARFTRVADIIWTAVGGDTGLSGEERDRAQEVVKSWRRAAGRLHQKSLEQLIRDKMVAEEGAGVLDFEEEHSPAQLLSIFDYGDLLHWGRHSDAIAEWEQDPLRAGDRRLAFLSAACALAHTYMGFAVLAGVATGRNA